MRLALGPDAADVEADTTYLADWLAVAHGGILALVSSGGRQADLLRDAPADISSHDEVLLIRHIGPNELQSEGRSFMRTSSTVCCLASFTSTTWFLAALHDRVRPFE